MKRSCQIVESAKSMDPTQLLGPQPRVLTETRPAPADQQDVTADPNAGSAAKLKGWSVQERVIHLLALKPYRINNLVQRLQRDGLTDQEHKTLNSVLDEVAVLLSEEYIVLKDRFFKDVEENWPGYLIEERHLLKRILTRKICQEDSNQEECRKSSTTDDPNPPESESPISTVWKRPRVSHIFKGAGRSPPRVAFTQVSEDEEEQSGSGQHQEPESHQDLSPKESEPIIPYLSSSEDEEELSGSGKHQEPEARQDLSPKEPKPFLPTLTSSEDEDEVSGCGKHQEHEPHPAPRTTTQSPNRNSPAPADQQDVTADPIVSSTAKLKGWSVQERLIHLLALKPYRINHLVQRLQRDGLTDQEHKTLNSVLDEVAVLQQKGYIVLKDRFLEDVEENWPGYLIEERHLLKRILTRKICQEDSNQEESWKSSTTDDPNPPEPAAAGVNPAAADEPVLQGAQAAAVQPQANTACLLTYSNSDEDETGE